MKLKRKILAVHDRDLEKFLHELDLFESVQAREINCPECDCKITLDNIGFISLHEKKVRICCDNLNCFYEMRRRIKGVSKE